MSLFESLESNGSVSLNSLFIGDDVQGISSLQLEDTAFALARGGWPASVKMTGEYALTHAYEYVNSVIKSDISRVDGVSRDPLRVERLIRSLARNISTTAKTETIIADVNGNEMGSIASDKTVYSYIDALRRIFVIEDLPAWSPNMRSRTTLRSASKRHFTDPSIAAALLGMSPEGLMNDFNTFGLLFESMCIRDLRVYAQAMHGKLFHYRDRNGLEVDAVISLRDGRWGAVEIKMGEKRVNEGIRNLKKFTEKVDLEKMGKPSFLMVMTAGQYAHRTNEGVYVVPAGCLKN